MQRFLASTLAAVLLAVPLLGGCDDDGEKRALAKATCTPGATDAVTSAALPAGFPAVGGYVPLGKTTQGKTTAYRGTVTGGPDDLPTVRDRAIGLLTAAGYREGGHDQEAGAEADGDFSGPQSGNVNVRNLCSGHLQVTYTLNG